MPHSTHTRGAVAAGHEATARAALFALQQGGNAFDAVIAAHWCACVAEPVLTSLGGGGFLLARAAGSAPRLYDFFAHTPHSRKPADEIDFRAIEADFGNAFQEFHIGYGSVATPGTVRGLFAIHRDLATLPMRVLVEPAVALAREGLVVNELQAYILDVVRPIYLDSAPAARRFASQRLPDRLVGAGETLHLPELGETLTALAEEGEALFYEGEIAQQIVRACHETGGHLQRQDLQQYRTVIRQPLQLRYRGAVLHTNPAPASGGLLVAFALKLVEQLDGHGVALDNAEAVSRLAQVMRCTALARVQAESEARLDERFLDEALLQTYIEEIAGRGAVVRGTTQISVMDAAGNVAALSTSNGEGCGHMLGDTGIMLNNMLGEADLNPHGFHRWPEDRRLTSMMAPSLLHTADGAETALGSGGSNRIRSAILQVLLRLVDQGLDLRAAIDLPRLHFEDELLSMEAGFDESVYRRLASEVATLKRWPERNLFFGGVHAVRCEKGNFSCHGDPRRGGVALSV